MELKVISRHEAAILKAIVRAMAAPGEGNDVEDDELAMTIDRILSLMSPLLQVLLRLLLWTFELLPAVFILMPKRFSRLQDQYKERYLRGWATSRLMPRRMVFSALKKVSLLGFYSSDRELEAIGYEPLCGGE